MRTRSLVGSLLCLAVLGASLPGSARAAGAPPDSAAARGGRPAHAAATAKRGSRSRAKSPARHGTAAGAAAASARSEAKGAGPRTLQDIHIEGEIPVPQVLFITAREQRRFVDFRTQRYLKTSQQVGEETVFPSRIVVTESRPADEPKENKP